MKNVWIAPYIAFIDLIILIQVFIFVVFIFLWSRENIHGIIPVIPSVSTPTPVTGTPTQSPVVFPNIIVTSPKPNQTIKLPIVITGQARVFENQFNYRIMDVNKNVIREGTAYATSSDAGQFGEFAIQVNSLPTMRANALTLEVFDYSAKDGKESDMVSIPVVVDPIDSIPLTIFFNSKQAPSGEECTNVYPVERHVVNTITPARVALEELLQGPITSEKNNDYYTSITDGVQIQKLTIENGVAKVDFNKKLEEGVGGSCRVTAIRTQIIKTLTQFPTVKNVVISIDGRTEDILQP